MKLTSLRVLSIVDKIHVNPVPSFNTPRIPRSAHLWADAWVMDYPRGCLSQKLRKISQKDSQKDSQTGWPSRDERGT
jgi:hypothetical protein